MSQCACNSQRTACGELALSYHVGSGSELRLLSLQDVPLLNEPTHRFGVCGGVIICHVTFEPTTWFPGLGMKD